MLEKGAGTSAPFDFSTTSQAAGAEISHHGTGVSTHLSSLPHSYWMASKMRVREARKVGKKAASCEVRLLLPYVSTRVEILLLF